MRTFGKSRWLGGLTALALVAAACGGGRSDETSDGASGEGSSESGGSAAAASPGITDTEIRLGSTFPFSGPASSYGTIARAEQAWFKYVNDELGGVKSADGKTRKITYNVLDDGYEAPRAVENARRLIEQEDVFALFNTLGTPGNTAMLDYVNDQEVPHLFVSSGASAWGVDPEEHPYTVGFNAAYTTEAAIYAEYLKQERPDAKVAVLYQNDDFGKDYLEGFKQAIGGSNIEIVAEQPYAVADPTVDAQVTNLSNAGADTFLNVTTPKFAAQSIRKAADLGWKPLHILSQVSASPETVYKPAGVENAEGIISANYFKIPGDPNYEDDPAMQQYREVLAKHGPELNPVDPNNGYGVAAAQTMVAALEGMQEPTREGLMEAVRAMDTEIPMLLDGVRVKLAGDEDGYPIESMQLLQFQGGKFSLVGDLIDYEGKTPRIGEGA